jgi:predicted phage tail component-like protein
VKKVNITFNGDNLSTYIKATQVNRGIIPERENRTYRIPKKSGVFYDGYTYKEKVITVDFMVVNADLNAVRRALASMLDVEEPAQLVFSDEPTFYWMAVPDGEVNLEEILKVGTGTINFLCPKPWAYKTGESQFILTPGQTKLTVTNNGSAPTSPKFTVNFSADCGFVGITSPQGIIQLGNRISPDTVAVPNSEKLINTVFSATGNTAWVKNTFQPLHINAQASGTVSEDANGVRTNSFGTWLANKQWHGPVMSKALATDTLGLGTADNWELYSEFHFRTLDSNAVRAMAMMEFGVFDDTGAYLAGLRFGDTMDIDSLVGTSLYVGKNPDGNGIEQAQLWDEGGYDYFNGSICITKMGNNFNFEIYNSTTGKVLNKTFYSEALGAKKAKTATVFMGKFKDVAAYNDMAVTYLKFTKHHTQTMKDVPNIFGNGDELIVDNETGKVTLNGVPYFNTLDIGSNFFPLKQGATDIGFIHSSWATQPTFKTTFQERYY